MKIPVRIFYKGGGSAGPSPTDVAIEKEKIKAMKARINPTAEKKSGSSRTQVGYKSGRREKFMDGQRVHDFIFSESGSKKSKLLQ